MKSNKQKKLGSQKKRPIEKLEKWVNEHPKEADLPAMNITTGKTFTAREVLKELKKEEKTGIATVDKEFLEVKSNIKKWLEEI